MRSRRWNGGTKLAEYNIYVHNRQVLVGSLVHWLVGDHVLFERHWTLLDNVCE
jgi:hypothetical protein